MPKTIADVAALVRSKNAGPFWLTFDIMMDNDADYQLVKNSKAITAELIAKIYKQKLEDVIVVEHDSARAIKVSIPRPYSNGSPEDTDIHGGQQYSPLLGLVVEK
jgi:hypothetical protein